MATPLPVQERERAACVDGQGERGEARLIADAFGDVLVERDGVAERTAGRVRGGRQEADVGRVAAIHVGMRDAGEDGEVLAVLLEDLEVVRGRVVAAGVGGEELTGQQAEVVADGEHAARRGGGLRAGRGGSHRVQKRQRQRRRRRRAASCGGRSARWSSP